MGIIVSGEIEIIVYDKFWNKIDYFKNKNLAVNGALTALAVGVGVGTNPFASAPSIKMGTSSTAVSATQTNLVAATAETGTLLARTQSSFTGSVSMIFNPTVSRVYAETGLFFGSTMWARVVLSPTVSVPANGWHTQKWNITFAAS